jgi:signal transduction histidine kinase
MLARQRTRMQQAAQNELAARLKAEEVKQKLEIALLQGQKLQAIGTLAGGIAHDFNNILYAIKGYVEMAREDVAQDNLVYRNLGKVLEAAQRGQDLIARILAFGRRHQQAEFVPISIKAIIESILELIKPTIPASIAINLIGLSSDCLIAGNQTQLHQVIVNIIINAVDAMEGEGAVTISLNRILAHDDYLQQFPQITDAHYCKIEISDTGHGMTQNTMERIFEPFYTTKEVGKGTGLGLSTVHSIIKQHHGEITVTSQLGKGTIFTILLPEHPATLTEKENSHGTYSFSGR